MKWYAIFIKRETTVNMLIISKLIYRYVIMTIKIPLGCTKKTDSLILKYVWKHKSQIIANILQKRGYTLSNIKTYYKACYLR